jgi:hypothetical protein
MIITSPKVFLDHKVEATGVHSAGTTTWTLAHPSKATRAVVHSTGQYVTLTQSAPNVFTASGNYAGLATLGIPISMMLELSKPFAPMNDRGVAQLDGSYVIRTLTIRHHIESAFKITQSFDDARADIETTYNPDPLATPETDEFTTRIRIGTNTKRTRIVIENLDWRGVEISSMQWDGHFAKGTR